MSRPDPHHGHTVWRCPEHGETTDPVWLGSPDAGHPYCRDDDCSLPLALVKGAVRDLAKTETDWNRSPVPKTTKKKAGPDMPVSAGQAEPRVVSSRDKPDGGTMNPPPAPERIEERGPCAASADPEPEAAPSRLAVAIDAIEAELDKATSRVEQIKAEIAALLREKRSEEKDVAAMRDALAYLRARVRDPEPPTDPEPRPEDGPDPAQIQATPEAEPSRYVPAGATRGNDPTPGTNSATILGALRALGEGTAPEVLARAQAENPTLKSSSIHSYLAYLVKLGTAERIESPDGNRWRAVR